MSTHYSLHVIDSAPDCSNGSTPVPIPASMVFPNVVDVARLIAQSVSCYSNTLPRAV